MHPRKDFEIFGKEVSVTVTGAHTAVFDGKPALTSGAPESGEFSAKACAMIQRVADEIPVFVPADRYGDESCLECNILHSLGGLIQPGDILYPKFERTGGAVMFTEKDGERRYLLIKNESGHIGFPKGHVDYGETIEQTAAREVKEETGLDFVPYGDFEFEYTYTTKEKSIKTGAFFIGHYDYREPVIQEDEILDDWLLPFEKALGLLNFPEDRELLTAAEEYISKRG